MIIRIVKDITFADMQSLEIVKVRKIYFTYIFEVAKVIIVKIEQKHCYMIVTEK